MKYIKAFLVFSVALCLLHLTHPVQTISWGAYVGEEISDLAVFEAKVGKPVDIRAVFVGWGTNGTFPFSIAEPLKTKGKTLLILWEPSVNCDEILGGRWQRYLKSFAASVKDYGAPVIIVPMPEMNGDWDIWGGSINGNTSAKFIASWKYIHGFFNDVPNAKFGWAVNEKSWPNTSNNQLEVYYPGDAYVDYVGVDGFNWNDPWMTFDQIFKDSLQRLKVFRKPIYIFSVASAQGQKKAEWINDALNVQIKKYPEIKGWVWFNSDKEKNWLVWSDSNSLEAFKRVIK